MNSKKPFFLFIICLFFVATTKAETPDFINQESRHFIEDEKNTIQIFKEASPLVVSVEKTKATNDFWSMNSQTAPIGSGTGFIWDKQGHIVTNFHVVQNSSHRRGSQIWVATKSGQRLKAKVIGVEPKKDIAILKVEGLTLPPTTFNQKVANSSQLMVGQKVLAIGNPFGFEQTLTTGVVSALNRSMPALNSDISIRNMVQTDASINPGNSGGPLLDSRGHLIGMNTAIVSGSGSSAGIGFAVPSKTIDRLAQQIIQYGKPQTPSIGITAVPSYGRIQLSRYGGTSREEGVIIESVAKGSPGDKAGLIGLRRRGRKVIVGDIITEVDREKVDDIDDLYNIVSEKNLGDTVELTVKRQGRVLHKKIQLAVVNVPS